jgi:hypothetical protein
MMKGNRAVAKGKDKQVEYDKENMTNGSAGGKNSALHLHPLHQRIEIDLRLDRSEASRKLKDGRCVICAATSEASILACAFCERDTCLQCVNSCGSCSGIFCCLCSTVRYACRAFPLWLLYLVTLPTPPM